MEASAFGRKGVLCSPGEHSSSEVVEEARDDHIYQDIYGFHNSLSPKRWHLGFPVSDELDRRLIDVRKGNIWRQCPPHLEGQGRIPETEKETRPMGTTNVKPKNTHMANHERGCFNHCVLERLDVTRKAPGLQNFVVCREYPS
jgi:hypothetical protein